MALVCGAGNAEAELTPCLENKHPVNNADLHNLVEKVVALRGYPRLIIQKLQARIGPSALSTKRWMHILPRELGCACLRGKPGVNFPPTEIRTDEHCRLGPRLSILPPDKVISLLRPWGIFDSAGAQFKLCRPHIRNPTELGSCPKVYGENQGLCMVICPSHALSSAAGI
ncbi:uncharacterized protein An07g04460 [Aspergillus niger]|uniref:Contig An07c0100, genomic contig n=2 Tax=Aspergillus niger TaxID=5061 RepID=A2QN55_ASPNC|nr:uncharacterized protein An07g04460 [Aspergillus niger]CAK48196.1 unnamed protein product [Aspergillus niger]